MLDIYLTRFALKGKTRKSAISDLRGWAADKLSIETEALDVDGGYEDGERLQGRWTVEGPSDNPTAIDVALTRRTDDGLVVVERVEILSAKRPLVRAAVSVAGTEGRRRPFYGGMYPPEFVSNLVEAGHAVDGPNTLVSKPWVVTSDAIRDLYGLLDGGRSLPVLCFSEDPENAPSIDPTRATALFLGAAHPVYLTYDAAMRFTQEKDKRWSTFLGAIRVYLPGVEWSASAKGHPLWLTDRHPDPEVIPDIARRVCVDEARWRGFDQWAIPKLRIDRIRSRTDSSEYDDWVELLETVETERDELQRETVSLRQEIERLELEAQGEPTVPPLSSISDALARVAEECGPEIEILDSAWASAAVASFRRPDRAFEVLQAVADLAKAYHWGELQEDFRSFLSGRGVKLGYVSLHVRSRWSQDYQRSYRGRIVELSDHAKIGTGTPENLFRVYWYRDEEERVLVVGHVGNHLMSFQS